MSHLVNRCISAYCGRPRKPMGGTIARPHPGRLRMLTRDEANNLVEALNQAGFECSLLARPTANSRHYQIGVHSRTLDLERLTALFEVMERFPDANLLVDPADVTIT